MYDFERVYKVTDLNHRLVSSLKMVDETILFRFSGHSYQVREQGHKF